MAIVLTVLVFWCAAHLLCSLKQDVHECVP